MSVLNYVYTLHALLIFIFLGYHYELALCLSGHVPIPKLYPLEQELETSCKLSSKKGLCSCFIYCLLDPMKTRNLPLREGGQLNDLYCFQTFISSVFYIGKGTNNRPLQHLREANKSWIVRHKRKCVRVCVCVCVGVLVYICFMYYAYIHTTCIVNHCL